MINGNAGITKSFNAVLFFFGFYLWILSIVEEDPEKSHPSHWDKIGEWSPAIGIGLSFLCFLILIVWGSWIVKQFWNRLLVDLIPVREINFDEALALILIIGILSI